MFALAKHDIYLVLNCDDEHVFFNFAISQSMNFSYIKCSIPELRVDNYMVWKKKVLLHLGWMDIDYTIRKEKPLAITETNTLVAVDLYEKWDRYNRLSMTFIKTNIFVCIRGSIVQPL